MTDRVITLQQGSAPAPDDARFRVGQFTMWAEVGKSSTRFDLAGVVIDYVEGQQLPQATLKVPLGTAVGPQTGNKNSQAANTVKGLNAAFAKFTPVKVYAEFGTPEIDESSVGFANVAGKKLLFSGRALSTTYSREGNTVVGIEVRCTQRMLGIMSGTSLFSKFVSATDKDLEMVLTPWGESALFNEPKRNVWAMFLETVDLLMGTSPQGEDGASESQITTTAAAVSGTKKYLTGVLSADDLKNLTAILGELQPTTNLLRELTGYITTKYPSSQAQMCLANIMLAIRNLLMTTRTNGNLLNNIGLLGGELFFRTIFTADKGYVIPYQPCWDRKSMKFLRGGTNFGTSSARGLLYGVPMESMQVAGTIVLAGVSSHWAPPGKDSQPAIISGGVYLLPNTDQEFNIADMELAPTWMASLVIFPNPQVTEAPSKEDTVPKAEATAPTDEAKNKALQDTRQKQVTSEFKSSFTKEFARFRTLDKTFGGNQLQFSCALRDDIVPGMNLAVVVGSSKNDDDEVVCYGHVAAVHCEISVSGNSGMAVQTVSMTHVRNDVEQDIVDQDYSYHFFWRDATEAINAIKLWS
jgi:hypothetical protein